MKRRLKEVMLGKWDVLIILAALLICVLWFALPQKSGGLSAVVYLDGEQIMSVELSSLQKSEEAEVSGCRLLFEPDGVTVLSADCPNQLCVRAGKLKLLGAVTACVPNKVVIVLRSEKQNADAVSY